MITLMSNRRHKRHSLAVLAIFMLSACNTVNPESGDLALAQGTSAPAPAPAAQPQPASQLTGSLAASTFGKTIAKAVETQPDLGVANADISAASADLLAAQGGFRPAFSIGANARARANDGTSSALDDNTSPYLRVRQLIYDGGATKNRRLEAEATLAKARDEQLVAASSLALTSVEVYLNVLSERERLALLNNNLETHLEFLSQMEERRSAGAGGQSDLLTIRSRVADAETLVIDGESRLEQANARFLQIFGRMPTSLVAPLSAPNLPSNNQQAVSRSPRLLSIDSEIKAAEARVEQAKALRRPTIELLGTALADNDGEPDALIDLSIDYQFNTQNEAAAALNRSNALLQRTRSEKVRLVRDILRSLEFLRVDRIAADKRLEAARAASAANQANVSAAYEEFTIGRRTLIEVLDAQRDFVRSEETVVASRREQLLVGYEALALTGDIVPVFGIVLPDPGRSQ